ncbi:MAG: NYN domain-containing protein [Desulfosalsimonadaceae bacterium]
MSLHVIIDGYNFIRQSEALRDFERQALEFGREALVERLVEYRRIKRHKITLVFDGSQKYFFPDANTSWKGVGIKFSRHGETADALIKKMARREKEKAVIVSNDRDIGRFAEANGATVLESGTFEEKLWMAEMMGSEESASESEPDRHRGNLTKKKGPAKKLPKKTRRAQKKTGKL